MARLRLCCLAAVLLAPLSSAYGQLPDPFADQFRADRPAKSNDKTPVSLPDVPPAPAKADVAVDPTTASIAKLIRLSASTPTPTVRRGEVIRIVIDGKTHPNAYAYSAQKRAAKQSGISARFNYTTPWVKPLFPIDEKTAKLITSEDGSGAYILHDAFTWIQDVYIEPDAPVGPATIDLRVILQLCTKAPASCLPPGSYPPLKVAVQISDAPPLPPPADLDERSKAPSLAPPPLPTKTTTPSTGIDDLGGLLVAAFVGAILMLLTPCVFPMIPITVNYFIKQSEREHHRPFYMASVYAGTIVALLTTVVMLVGNSIIQLANEPWFNLGLGIVLVLFALGLFGMFDVGLTKFFGTVFILLVAFGLSRLAKALFPGVAAGAGEPYIAIASIILALPATWLLAAGLRQVETRLGFEESTVLRFLSHQEARGGALGAVFMAMTFTITSFSCTGPFLGILLAPLAGMSLAWHRLLLGALVYSVTFAAPFFLLALFPTFLKKLPKSGGWMDTIKVTMGFLEIGAAVKFLANVDLFWFPGDPRFFTYDTVLCAWIALSLACSLYLFGVFRLHHDVAEDHISVPRMIFASLFLGMAFYLTPLLFNVTPKGVIMEAAISFLPPDLKTDDKIAWVKDDYPAAWKKAVAEKKLIFIDFTGQNCVNCRANERNAFTQPSVLRELEKYVPLKLFTDSVPNPMLSASQASEQGQKHQMWQYQMVDRVTNPTYVLFKPDPSEPFQNGRPNGEVLGMFEGLITDTSEFVEFLRKPLAP